MEVFFPGKRKARPVKGNFMYKGFAEIYDRLTQDIEYVKWADYLESAFLKFHKKPSLILDLGCGTGNMTLEMASRGYEMIGVDLAPGMLSKADEKARQKGLDILFLNQDMCEFELYGTVDVVICMLDSINYIIRQNDLNRVFKLVHNYLNPGGLFIFDINSDYKLSRILGNETFYELDEDVSWIWQNTYDSRKKLCYFDLTFFLKTDGGLYDRFEETHIERAYSNETIKKMLNKSHLQLLGSYGELRFNKPAAKEQRIFYISQKEST